jgi:hypothetical protein
MDDFLRAALDALVSSTFDPPKVRGRTLGSRAGTGVATRVRTGDFDRWSFPSPLQRTPFLNGCLAATRRSRIEHLIVGYGSKQGSRTVITALGHVRGGANSVEMPQSLTAAINIHLVLTRNAEVVVFHNHPDELLECLLDDGPVGSPSDKRWMAAMRYGNLLSLGRLAFGLGGVKFYLGVEGHVREMKAPSVLHTLEYLSQQPGP